MEKKILPNKIIWLASYPKSGNTWYRAFLTALFNNGELDINRLSSDGIFSSRDAFDLYHDINSRHLYDHEAKQFVADIHREKALKKNISIIKIHDVFGVDFNGNYIVPEDVTHCAIYFVRNPLDLVGSFANHMNMSIQTAINTINSEDSMLLKPPKNTNTKQFSQHLSDWSSHVNSWMLKPSFPVMFVRYEDMLLNTLETFTKTLEFIGWDYSLEQIAKALDITSFQSLKEQELKNGFQEKPPKSKSFFRSGTTENWKKELNENQIKQIISKHSLTMSKFNYFIDLFI